MANFVFSVSLLLTILTLIETQQLLEQRLQSYQRCRYDSDCKPNSFCYGNDDTLTGYCKCRDGYELNRNTTFYECLQAARLDEPCEKDFQCQLTAGPLAICNRYKICECNPQIAHNYIDGLCYLTTKLTESCLTDPNCKLSDGRFGFCTFGHCTCRNGEIPSNDLQSCLLAKRLGELCNDDWECSTMDPNTICNEACICNMEHVLSRDAKQCLKAATSFGEPCEEDQQCSDYLYKSICVDGRCSCDENYHPNGLACVRTARLGEECFSSAECVYDKELEGYIQCSRHVCQCVYGESDKGCKLQNNSNIHRIYFKQILCVLFISSITHKLLYN